MNTNNHSEIVRKMNKQALLVYGLMSAVVYSCALAYCYFTNHFLETGIVGTVMLGLGILIVNFYLSIEVKSEKHETEHSFKHATE